VILFIRLVKITELSGREVIIDNFSWNIIYISAMRVIKSVFLIINYKTFIVTLLAVASTWLCGHYGFSADFPLTIIGIAIVFPVVFSIDSAYKRRERTLMLLADFRGHCQALYIASGQWLNTSDMEFQGLMKEDLVDIYKALRAFCTNTKKSKKEAFEMQLFVKVSQLSQRIQLVRGKELNPGEISRMNQYVSKILVDIENIKMIRTYRTPLTLRAYSRIFIYSFPIIYGPYFEYTASSYAHGLEYVMPVMFSFILISLDNIQEHLENPFDQIGEDDVKFDVEQLHAMLN
jgi:predicted membrane chloride channel (bestrophin family)